jgi:hypothetical protein
MRRVWAVLAATLAVWLGFGAPAGAIEAATASAADHAYAYVHHPAAPASTTTERSPPAEYDRNNGYDADGQVPRGVAERPNGLASPATYDYDDATPFVHPAPGGGGAEEPARNAGARSVVFQPAGVATNGGSRSLCKAPARRWGPVEQVGRGCPHQQFGR